MKTAKIRVYFNALIRLSAVSTFASKTSYGAEKKQENLEFAKKWLKCLSRMSASSKCFKISSVMPNDRRKFSYQKQQKRTFQWPKLTKICILQKKCKYVPIAETQKFPRTCFPHSLLEIYLLW